MGIKYFLGFLFIIFSTATFAQIPKSGTYTYNYCDEEYNKCIGKCKIKIKGNKIWIYAPAGLSLTKEGELSDSGTLYKQRSGKWRIIHSNKQKNAPNRQGPNGDGPTWIDFKRKRFWTY